MYMDRTYEIHNLLIVKMEMRQLIYLMVLQEEALQMHNGNIRNSNLFCVAMRYQYKVRELGKEETTNMYAMSLKKLKDN